jgi:hypothetical protein
MVGIFLNAQSVHNFLTRIQTFEYERGCIIVGIIQTERNRVYRSAVATEVGGILANQFRLISFQLRTARSDSKSIRYTSSLGSETQRTLP